MAFLKSVSFSVTEGSLGRSGVAYEYLKSVPKLVVRKTQLENFLNRKVLALTRIFLQVFQS